MMGGLILARRLDEKGGSAGLPSFWKIEALEGVESYDHALKPGRYVGAADVDDNEVPFAERFAALWLALKGQFHRATQLTNTIPENLTRIGADV
jgi:type I restriction enzyme M protein